MKRILTAVLVLSLALSLCACGSGTQDETPTYPAGFSALETLIDDARDEGRLTVCGDGDKTYMAALCQKFEMLFGISVTFRPTAQAEDARGDVWFGGSSDGCRALAAEGKLLAYSAENAGHLTNAAFGDSDGYWYGVAADAVVFAVNADVLRRMGISAPKDWADLTDPVYRELLWVPDYRTTKVGQLAAQDAVLQLGREDGIDFLTELDTSVQFYTAADDTFVKCLPTGECVIAVGWLHDGLAALQGDGSDALRVIVPASGTFGTVSASAIMADAGHPNAARLWQEFVLSAAGADIAAECGDYRLPTVDEAALVQSSGVALTPSLLTSPDAVESIEDADTLIDDLIQALTDSGIDVEDTDRWDVS